MPKPFARLIKSRRLLGKSADDRTWREDKTQRWLRHKLFSEENFDSSPAWGGPALHMRLGVCARADQTNGERATLRGKLTRAVKRSRPSSCGQPESTRLQNLRNRNYLIASDASHAVE